MAKNKTTFATKYENDFLENNSIITDLGEWRLFIKKNTWKKLYRKQTSKIGVIDSFCASFSHCSDEIWKVAGTKRGDYQALMKEGESISQIFATSGVEIQNGWTIHRHWFRSMVSQLVLSGATDFETQATRYEMLTDLFSELKWGKLQTYLNPEYNDITSTMKLPYMSSSETGIKTLKHYTVLIEPTSSIPCGSKWISAQGFIWQAGLPNENGTIDFETTGDSIDGAAVPHYFIKLTVHQIYGMKRFQGDK